ncbi:MAG: sulfatase-like hydrolase/transferase [Planctomycetia bacterium]|nr:sulfatase-like hydrolase/transferase [Planctomycetia bacterium]
MRFTITAFVSLLLAAHATAADKPNIVLIMADDFGYECVGCNGGAYKTPNLDALAASGVRFTHAYATPLCTPSRVQLMTGRYNFRNYVTFGQLDLKEKTFAHVLKAAGYSTFIAGKWQLAGGLKGPNDAGFDEYCLWQIFEQNKGSRYAAPKLHANGKLLEGLGKKYGPDVFEEYIEDFISRNKDKPFLVYWPMVLTHSPFEPTPDSKPDAKPGPATFPDMVAYTDKLVGKLVAHLEKLKLRENTLILFLGDNGTGKPITSKLNGKDVKGDKGNTTTLGTHVPLIASWPGTHPQPPPIREGARGRVCADLIDFTDMLPTLAAVAGAELPRGVTLDGRSFLPQVKGEKGNPREWIFCHYEPRHGKNTAKVRYAQDTRFKLYNDGRMFDLEKDPLEQKPLPVKDARDPDREKLKAVLDKFEKEAPFGK